MTIDQEMLKREAAKLYDRYAKPLESEHSGKFIVISPTGDLLLGDSLLELTQGAAETLGRGTFVFKIGSRAVGSWR